MINAISSFLPIMSKEYYSQKYKRNGLLIRKRAAKAGYSLAIYCKGEELRHSLKTQNRATLYTNRIGETGEDIANRTLRLELHMKKFAVIREFLEIPNQERLFVPLREILDSVATPILNVLKEWFIHILTLLNVQSADTVWLQQQNMELIIAELMYITGALIIKILILRKRMLMSF